MTRKLSFNQSSKYPFDLDKVLYAGQDFRWCKWKGDWHSGVLKGNLIHIRQANNVLKYKSHPNPNLDEMLRSYFRLDDPIDEIYDDISCRDAKVKKLVKKYPWLRVLRQPDPWECTVAYICSARAGVPKIRKNVEAIARKLGHQLDLDDNVRYSFPSAGTVLGRGEKPLEELHLGFKRIPPYIIAASKRISTCDLNLTELSRRPYAEAIRQLMEEHSASRKVANGISLKVANCIALFSLHMTRAFPVDRHVWNAVKCYFPSFQHRDYDDLRDSHKKKIISWAQNHFGEHAGHANQFLFYWKLEESLLRRGRKPLHEQRHSCLSL